MSDVRLLPLGHDALEELRRTRNACQEFFALECEKKALTLVKEYDEVTNSLLRLGLRPIGFHEELEDGTRFFVVKYPYFDVVFSNNIAHAGDGIHRPLESLIGDLRALGFDWRH